MVSFVSDYTTGAHPEVLAKLAEANAIEEFVVEAQQQAGMEE